MIHRRLLAVVLAVTVYGLPLAAFGAVKGGPARSARNGIAILYSPGPFDRDYSASAMMALPRVRFQRSWYSTWLMLVSNGAADRRGFLQGGLIRWSGRRYALSAFVAFRAPGGRFVFKDLGQIPGGAHRVRLVGDQTNVFFQIDGKTRYQFQRADFFRHHVRPYLQVGAEVKDPYDRAVGTIWSLRLKRDRDQRSRFWTPACIRYDRGLHFVRVAGRYVAAGYFVPTKPSGFLGCRNFVKR